jgi:RNA polymerase sigma-70 factor (family 1)
VPEPLLHTEKELLHLAAAGDQQAFTQLFQLSKHKLYSFLLRLTQSPEMTEDVIQDIFLKLWRNRATLHDIDSFSSYIFRMAQNQCITHFKRVAKETLILARLQKEAMPSESTTDNQLAAREVQERLQTAIAKLSPRQKAVFTLSREQGLKHEEIARQLNISISTVKNHMIEALSILRQHFNTQSNILLLCCLVEIITAVEK